MWITFFAWLGFGTFIVFLYESLLSPVQLLYHKWLENNDKATPLLEKYGNWAAVTGATDGIGKSYAKELARHGLNIVLISRNLLKLNQVAKEIELEFGVEVFVIQTDFTEGPQVYDHLYQELAKRPIGILVNNVGIGHNPPGLAFKFTPEHMWDVINVNIGAATLLSRHFVEKWSLRGTKGCIVNISSITALQPIPYGSVYAASKAYITSFTLALREEVKPLGITVQLVSPLIVVTQIHKYSTKVIESRNRLLTHRAEAYSKWAVETLGKVDDTTGYYLQGILMTIWKLLNVRLRSKLLMMQVRYLADDKSNMVMKKSPEK